MDLIGHFLRLSPEFRGKWRIIHLWSGTFDRPERRIARLPGGVRIEVDMALPFERMIWLEREEWQDLCTLHANLQPGDMFIDVGANLGTWALVGAAAVGIDGRVLALEPNSKTAGRLRDNIALNTLDDRVKVLQAAASDKEGVCGFSCPLEHNLSSVVPLGSAQSFEVQTVRLDDVAANVFPDRVVRGMKIDAEGHENEVLEGCDYLLSHHKPWLIIEFNTTLLDSTRFDDWPVAKRLALLGYKPFLMSSKEISPIPDDWRLDGYCNVLFLFDGNNGSFVPSGTTPRPIK